jgi:periplasmic protein TonB
MKNHDNTSQSEASARLDALLSDFLNKEIVQPAGTRSLSAASEALSEPLAQEAAKPALASSPTPAEAQKVVPVDRTEVWEASSKPLRSLGSRASSPAKLAADPLEKPVNAIPADSSPAARGKKGRFGLPALLLLIVAGWLIWRFQGTGVPSPLSEDPAATLSPAEIDTPQPDQTPAETIDAAQADAATSEANEAASSNNSNDARLTASSPDSSVKAGVVPAENSVSQPAVSGAAQLQPAPPPDLSHSNPEMGVIQNLPSLQPGPPEAPLQLPPTPTDSAATNVVPDSIRKTLATPAVPLTKVQPHYPDLARRMNVSGTVRVAIIVDTAGKVTSAKAVDGPSVLQGPAEQAVRQWLFRPATMNGEPVAGSGTVSVVFSLAAR